jgi:hypothetical protein
MTPATSLAPKCRADTSRTLPSLPNTCRGLTTTPTTPLAPKHVADTSHTHPYSHTHPRGPTTTPTTSLAPKCEDDASQTPPPLPSTCRGPTMMLTTSFAPKREAEAFPHSQMHLQDPHPYPLHLPTGHVPPTHPITSTAIYFDFITARVNHSSQAHKAYPICRTPPTFIRSAVIACNNDYVQFC